MSRISRAVVLSGMMAVVFVSFGAAGVTPWWCVALSGAPIALLFIVGLIEVR